jgi:predicted ribosome quality control (RQC) complex YloA/Tae2 family protein
MIPYRPYIFIKKNNDLIYHSLKSSVILEQKHQDRFTIFDIKKLAVSTIFNDYRMILDKLISLNKRKLNALSNDTRVHQHHLIMKEIAESLYDYSDDSIPIASLNEQYQLQIPLYLTSKRNLLEYLFNHYKKAKKGLQMTADQSRLTTQYIEELTTIYDLCSGEDSAQLLTIKSFLEKHHILKSGKPFKEKVQAISPYQIYYNGTKISYGKNQRQNHHLTFHLAQKKHIFVHIKDVSGSHIIIHHHTFDHALLLFAGQLALHLSKKQSGEITYAKVGSLKATSTTGQVLVKDFKTLKINKDFNLDLDKILRESTRY